MNLTLQKTDLNNFLAQAWRRARCGVFAALLLGALIPAGAATATWNASATSDGNWQNPLNWGGVLPTFDNTLDVTITGTYGYGWYGASNYTVQSLTYPATATTTTTTILADSWPYTVGRTLTFDSATGTPYITLQNGGWHALGFLSSQVGQIILNKNLTITNNNNNGGGFYFGNGNRITGTSSVTIVGSGTGPIFMMNTNTFSGGLNLNAGTLAGFVGTAGTVASTFGVGNLTLGAGTALMQGNGTLATYTTPIVVNGNFSITGVSGAMTLAGPVNLGAVARTITVSADATISGVVSDAGAGFVKAGAGALTLSGTNTFTGNATVSTGTLTLSGPRTAAAGPIQMNGGTLNLQNGNFSLGANPLYVGVFGTATVNHTAGNLSFTSGGAMVLVGNAGCAGLTETYNLSGGSLTGVSGGIYRGVMLGVNAGVAGFPVTANFNLSGTGTLNMGSSALLIGRADFNSGFVNATFAQTGGTATFGTLSIGGMPSGTYSATNVNSTLSLTGGTFTNTSFSYLAAGETNTATITIGGTADVTLGAFPTYRGNGSSATLTFNGGTLRPAAASAVYLQGLTSAALTANGANFAVASGRNITVAQGLQDAPAQTGTLTKSDPGTLTLSGANTYTGATTVSNGTLLVNGSLSTGAVAVKSGATLGGNGTIGGAVTVEAGGTIQPGSGGTNIATLIVNNNLDLAGTTSMVLNRAGAQTASQVSGIAALTCGGTLTVTNVGAALQSGDSFTLFTAGSSIGTFSATNLPPLSAGLFWATTNNYVSIQVLGTFSGLSATNQSVLLPENTATNLVLTSGGTNLTYSILTGPTNGSLSGLNTNTGAVTYTPAANYNGADSFTFVAFDGTYTSTGTVSLWVGPVTWTGATDGNWGTAANWNTTPNLPAFGSNLDVIITGSNPYLWLGAADRTVQSLTFPASATTVLSVRLTDADFTTGRNLIFDSAAGTPSITIAAGSTWHTLGTQNGTGSIILNKNLTINNNSINTNGFYFGNSRPITGASSITIAGTGTAPIYLRDTNTFSGGLYLNSGTLAGFTMDTNHPAASTFGTGNLYIAGGTTLAQGNLNPITYTTPIVVNGDFTLTYTISGYNNSMTLGGTMNLGAVARRITVSANIVIAGVMSGLGGGLTKAGGSILTLSGANTYTGATTVSNGTLLVNGSISTGAVAVKSGATLGGNGTIGGAVTVEAGGILAPGTNAIGTLSISNALTLAAGSTTLVELANASKDAVAGLTAVNFNGTLTVTNLGGSFVNGDTYQIFSAASYAGNFAATNLPALDPGLKWNWNPANGTLAVAPATSYATTSTNITYSVGGGILTLTWPGSHLGWLAQSNSVNLANTNFWFDIAGSQAVTNLNITINPAMTNVFYRLRLP